MDLFLHVDDPRALYPHPAAELAVRFGVDEKTINRWCRDGDLPAFKGPGGAWWVRPVDLIGLDVRRLAENEEHGGSEGKRLRGDGQKGRRDDSRLSGEEDGRWKKRARRAQDDEAGG